MTTATKQQKKTTTEARQDSPLLTPLELLDALTPREKRFVLLEAGRTNETEQPFCWVRNGAWRILERDEPTLDEWLHLRQDADPKVSPVLLSHAALGATPHPARLLWASVPIEVTPLQSPNPSQYRNSLVRIDPASEREAFGRLLSAQVAPNLLVHEGHRLVGLWRLDRPIEHIELSKGTVLELTVLQLARRLGVPGALGISDRFLLPGQVIHPLIPRQEAWARWVGEAEAFVARDQMDQWIWGDLERPSAGGPLTALQLIQKARPY